MKLPDNIATNESIGKLIDEKLSATSTDGTLKKVMEQLPGSLSKGVADVLSDNLGDKVKDALYEGFRREFAYERRKLYDVVNDMRYKAQSITGGNGGVQPHIGSIPSLRFYFSPPEVSVMDSFIC